MRIFKSGRGLPVDLVLILVLTLLAIGAAVLPAVNRSPLRIVFGFVFVFYIPGYVLTAVLFPRSPVSIDYDAESLFGPVDRNFTGLERTCLSVGLSISVVALLALGIDASPLPLSLGPLLVSVGGFTVVGTLAAAYRRLQLPSEVRFRPQLRSKWRGITARVTDTRSDRIINALLALSILLASMSITYAATTPREDQKYTRFYLLSENDDDELVADNYTDATDGNGTERVVVGVENLEHERVDYSVVVISKPVENSSESDSSIPNREAIRYDVSLSHGEVGREEVELPPVSQGESRRLQFLLYRGEVPAEPNAGNAYRYTHLLVDEGPRDGTSDE